MSLGIQVLLFLSLKKNLGQKNSTIVESLRKALTHGDSILILAH